MYVYSFFWVAARVTTKPDSILCWLPGLITCLIQHCSPSISLLSLSISFIIDNLTDRRYRSSADGLSTDNQTNLAIKGIIAIEAMSKMSSIAKQDAAIAKYSVRVDLLHLS